MKNDKSWSIKRLMVIPLIVMALTFILNLWVVYRDVVFEEEQLIINTSLAELVKESHEITQKTLLIKTTGTTQERIMLQEVKSNIEYFITIYKNGGVLKNGSVIKMLDESLHPILNSLSEQWNPMRDKLEIIISNNSQGLSPQDTSNVLLTKDNRYFDALDYVINNNAQLELHCINLFKEHNKFYQKGYKPLYRFIVISIFLLTIIFVFYKICDFYIVRPIRRTIVLIDDVIQGNLNKTIQKSNNPLQEVKIIENSIQKLHHNLYEKVNFVEEIKDGNYEINLNLDSENDLLGQTLLTLKSEIKKASDEDTKRKEEEQKRNGVTVALSNLVELLRKDNDNLENLTYNVLEFIVNFLNANQGGVFIINDHDQQNLFLEQTACIAYNRRRYLQKRIEKGEGIIGRCIMEQKTIFLTQLPKGYITITSGLGEATPSNLIAIPLKYNGLTYGVLEIASFVSFEPYQLDFLEKTCENLASTISQVKISIQTASLLKDSQLQAEIMQQQEEQMRSSMKKLQEAQKEAILQEEKLISFTNSVNHTLIRAEYDINGVLIYANTRFIHKLGYTSNIEVEGHHISMFVDAKDREWFKEMWEPLSKGGQHFEGNMKHKTKYGADLWMIATYTSVRGASGTSEKILFLAIDTTKQKEESLDHKGKIDALYDSAAVAEFSSLGKFVYCNDIFLHTMMYNFVELENKTVFDLVEKKELLEFKVIWDNAVKGIPFKGEVRRITQSGDIKWFHATYTAVRNMYDEINKVIFIGNDITEQKQYEIKVIEQSEILKKQEFELKDTIDKLASNEDELMFNIEELKATTEEMSLKQDEIRTAKENLEKHQEELAIALEKAYANELEVNEKNNALLAQEEEMRQNLEELQATQEEMERKQEELLTYQSQIEMREKEAKEAYEKIRRQEAELKDNNEMLLATQEELRQNLEELQATQEEMERKQEEIMKRKDKEIANMKNVFNQDLDSKNKLIEELQEKILKLEKTK